MSAGGEVAVGGGGWRRGAVRGEAYGPTVANAKSRPVWPVLQAVAREPFVDLLQHLGQRGRSVDRCLLDARQLLAEVGERRVDGRADEGAELVHSRQRVQVDPHDPCRGMA